MAVGIAAVKARALAESAFYLLAFERIDASGDSFEFFVVDGRGDDAGEVAAVSFVGLIIATSAHIMNNRA